ncbi:MAG: PLP-dependent aminotransferase family protein [Actinobacteria bacterium]|nr:PLP-dependent aminotransferase family protein [Actinomycetota bacterium]MCG2817690.1 PLP-dependent aminotransferase family protein [Actinomycetes bacterium]MBU4179270.1 PLP-dependent aminotransferase family protein [Actinomycetota bacterium]MBU4217482.1 PLP-dependent aminotransferase family protein [Actinomycetota bacterium]MBU4358187.1 PLP-dependent aminotransferase family protein [Actinomycetota bacterium]
MSPEIVFDPYTKLYSEATELIRSSDIRDLMSVTGRSDIVSFAGGLPFVGGLPPEDLSSVMASVLSLGMDEAFQYCETDGLETLKSRLIEIMALEGLEAEPEHVLVTTGSQQALDLLARLFIDPGDTIVTEGPTYVGALAAFRPVAPRIVTVPLDDLGIRTSILREEMERPGAPVPKFIYVVPNFHNPAGVTMHHRRRRELLDIAREHDVLVLEDNPYGLLRFEGESLPPLASHDRHHVIYIGTLSKIVAPGIRVGWVLAPAPVIDRLSTLKQSADLCSSSLNQMFAEEYLRRGFCEKNLVKLREIYRSRRDVMLKSLEKHFPPEAHWTIPQGGIFIWVTLPEYLDSAKMLPMAIDRKVAFVPGSAFYPDGSGANRIRLNFSFPHEDRISWGIEVLGEVVRKEMDLYRSLGLDKQRRGGPESPA